MTRVLLIRFFCSVYGMKIPLNDCSNTEEILFGSFNQTWHSPSAFYIATATKNRYRGLPQLHNTLWSGLFQHIPSGTSWVWNCCANWTYHAPFWLTFLATTAFHTQLIGLPLGFWPIALTQTQYCFIQSVPAGEEAIWHHQGIFPFQADSLN